MKSLMPLVCAIGCVGWAASLASAQYPALSPVYCRPYPQNPDGCGPGYYYYDCYGTQYGPTYHVVPPWQPFNGVLPVPRPVPGPNGKPMIPGFQAQGGPPQQPTFPSHPYMRSPRDYFMWNEAQNDRSTREQLPRFTP